MSEWMYRFLQTLFSLLPIQKKKIFFLSYYGSQYGCNPKYLSEYIVNNHKDWQVVWGFVHPDKYHIAGIRKLRYLSWRFFYELCTSQVFVTNYRMPLFYKKRAGQLYVQTWHSSLRLKMIEKDAEQTLPPHYVEMAKIDSKRTDLLLSGCQFSTEIFKRSFWYNGPIVPTGTPREDLLFHEEGREEIKRKLSVPKDCQLILYAPTFRKDNSLRYYDIDFRKLVQTLEETHGGQWKVLLRLHPHLRDFSKELCKEACVIDATAYDDIQELLKVADVVISDYSSLIFDFALTKRPCLLYVPDLEEYTKKDRQLYFNVEQLPFPICLTNEQLLQQIAIFDEAKYKQDIQGFLESIGSFETGHASENVFNQIISYLKK